MGASGASLKQITNSADFRLRYLGQIKGKQQAIKIYECFDGDIPSQRDLKLSKLFLFEEGIQHYFNQSFTQVAMSFESVLKQNRPAI